MWVVTAGDACAQEQTSFVWMDRAAREAGVVLTVDDRRVDATLPVEVEERLEVRITVGDTERAAWIQGGLVYLIQGEEGVLRVVHPSVNVDPDRVLVIAEPSVVGALADSVGGGWYSASAPGTFELYGPGIYAELSTAALPNEALDFAPIGLDGGSRVPAVRVATPRVTPGEEATSSTVQRGSKVPRRVFRHRRPRWFVSPVLPPSSVALPDRVRPDALVGWYCWTDACLVLGVGGYAQVCTEALPPDDAAEPRPRRAFVCAGAGAWAAEPGGVRVGERRWGWVDGALRPVGDR